MRKYYAGYLPRTEDRVLILGEFQERELSRQFRKFQVVRIEKVYFGDVNIEANTGTHISEEDFQRGAFHTFDRAKLALHGQLKDKGMEKIQWGKELLEIAGRVLLITEDA